MGANRLPFGFNCGPSSRAEGFRVGPMTRQRSPIIVVAQYTNGVNDDGKEGNDRQEKY